MELLRSKADLLDVLAGKAALFASVTSLAELGAAYKALPTQWMLTGHCLFAATMAPDFKDRFLLHFWVGAPARWAALGGGVGWAHAAIGKRVCLQAGRAGRSGLGVCQEGALDVGRARTCSAWQRFGTKLRPATGATPTTRPPGLPHTRPSHRRSPSWPALVAASCHPCS